MKKNLKFKKITIVGLGLMGGSLAAVCRRKFPKAKIIGVTRNKQALTLCKKNGWIHEGTKNLLSGIKNSDLIILCTPVDTFIPLLKRINKCVSNKILVTDVGSVKADILKQLDKQKLKSIVFVGAHPMVGSHKSGIKSANSSLYNNGNIILIRSRKTCPKGFAAVKGFWQKISSNIIELDPKSHDQMVCEISHLPHVVAACLMHMVSDKSLKIASTGFRDSTRIAASSPLVWHPIFKANREDLRMAISTLELSLKNFKKHLQSKDSQELMNFLKKAGSRRQKI